MWHSQRPLRETTECQSRVATEDGSMARNMTMDCWPSHSVMLITCAPLWALSLCIVVFDQCTTDGTAVVPGGHTDCADRRPVSWVKRR